jgi:hypothetical protein
MPVSAFSSWCWCAHLDPCFVHFDDANLCVGVWLSNDLCPNDIVAYLAHRAVCDDHFRHSAAFYRVPCSDRAKLTYLGVVTFRGREIVAGLLNVVFCDHAYHMFSLWSDCAFVSSLPALDFYSVFSFSVHLWTVRRLLPSEALQVEPYLHLLL